MLLGEKKPIHGRGRCFLAKRSTFHGRGRCFLAKRSTFHDIPPRGNRRRRGGKQEFVAYSWIFPYLAAQIKKQNMENDIKDPKRLWKVLKSEYLYRDAWLTARKDTVELPNGNCIPNYYILEYPNWVHTIAITKEGKFIFIRQYRHGIQEVRYELCAGVCDATDASPLASAQRELLEETGYGKGKWEEYMKVCANPSTMTNWTYTFVATDVELVSAPHREPTEDLSVHFLIKEEVVELLERDEIKQSLHAAALWKYVAKNHLI